MEPYNPFASAARANPYPAYDDLRANDPIHWSAADAWLVTRFADVRSLLGDTRLRHWSEALGTGDAGSFASLSGRWFSLLTPAARSVLRAALVRTTSPSALQQMAPRIAGRARALRDRGLAEGRMDIVTEFAEPLALSVAADLTGIAEPRQVELSAHIRSLPGGVLDLIERVDTPAAQQLVEFLLDELIGASSSADGLLAVLATMVRDGSLDVAEAVSFTLLFLFAAHENLAGFLGNAVLALLSHADQWTRLSAPGAIDELLRFDSPLQFMPLVVERDLHLDATHLACGERVLLGLGAANRDPARFSRPHCLDLDRQDGGHVSFGAGPLQCMGAGLARLEARIALLTLAETAGAIRPPAEPLIWRTRPAVSRSLTRLPVTFHV